MTRDEDDDTPVDLQPDVIDDAELVGVKSIEEFDALIGVVCPIAEDRAVDGPPDRAFEQTPETPAIIDPCRWCQMTTLLRVSDGTPPPKSQDKAWELGTCFATSSDAWNWCNVRGLFNGRIDWNRRSRVDPFKREERRRPARAVKPSAE